jgi:hypothetical protein
MKETPIIINNFNWLSSTRKMYEFLRNRNFDRVVILDNASTYPPLLEWYATLETGAVVQYPVNYGAYCLYDGGYLRDMERSEYIVYTDPDLELNPQMPDDFLEIMRSKLLRYEERKIGLALRIDDVPLACYGNCFTGSINHERQFWTQGLEKDVYRALVDTTFCLIRHPAEHDLKALRIAGPFTARHLPWYHEYARLTEEEQYFVAHANPQSNFRNGFLRWQAEQMTSHVS